MTDKAQTKLNFAIPKDRELHGQNGCSPVEVSQFVRYALSELRGTNGHHEFEQMCFQLARKRIYPNIIPSTGPVSAGGDQGADFETYEVGSDAGLFFGQASKGKVVFACSIEKNVKKKIRSDLDVIAKAQPSTEKVVFFSNQAIPVGARHKLQEYSKATHSVTLEVFDLLGIAELLADPEVFWIATRFLSISSEVFLATTEKKTDWYQKALTLDVDAERLTTDEFIRIKSGLREQSDTRLLGSRGNRTYLAFLRKCDCFVAVKHPAFRGGRFTKNLWHRFAVWSLLTTVWTG